MKNTFEEEKTFDSRARFFWKIVPYWAYFGQGEDSKLITELSKKCNIPATPINQKRLKWNNKCQK